MDAKIQTMKLLRINIISFMGFTSGANRILTRFITSTVPL